MGIALAHVYQLRQQFSQIDERADRLRTLLLTAKSSVQGKHSNYPRKRARPQKLSVSFTWYHYGPKKGRYTQVREQLGGGRRVQLINRNATSSEIFQRIVNIFFPNGINKKKQHLSSYTYSLGDYALQKVADSSQKDEVFFTLENYVETNSLKQAKFTLLTNDQENYQKKKKKISLDFSDDSDDDDFEGLPYTSTPSRAATKQVEYSAEDGGSIKQTNHDDDKVV